MNTKAFKVGQTAFVMWDGYNQRNKYSITEATVVKVGRKYVTAGNSWGMQFKETADCRPYLIEHLERGTPRLLFPSKEAVDVYIERENLKNWVRVMAGWDKIDRYTVEQLRAVKKILEEDGNG